jgi:beta-glucosidase
MTSLNTVNGIPATAKPFTLGEVLRDEWHYEGLVLIDYEAIQQRIPQSIVTSSMRWIRRSIPSHALDQKSNFGVPYVTDPVRHRVVPCKCDSRTTKYHGPPSK